MRFDAHHADESLIAEADEARREPHEASPINELHTTLRNMPGGDAVARSLLRVIAAELEIASLQHGLI
jgi:hypothetical protein